jgi:outer membrane protein OmpA-like peptidoglycan-associated protein
MESSAVEQSAGSCDSPATTILATSFGGAGLGARLSTVEGLQREITSLRKTLEVVQEAKVDGQSTRGAAGRVDTQIDHACAALESKQLQIVDLHSQLLALKGKVNPPEMEKRLREKERGRETELGAKRARQKEREEKAREQAAAVAEVQILKTLAADQITFEANSAKLTDKGSSLVRRVSPAIRGLGRMLVEIHGHCKCDCGNNDLSHGRASAVADMLKEEGCENDFVIVAHADLHPEIKAQMLVRIVPRPDTAGSAKSDEGVRAGGRKGRADLQRASGRAPKDDKVGAVCGSLMHSSSSGSVSSVDSDTESVAGQAAMEGVSKLDDGCNMEGVKMWAGSGSGKACDPLFAQRCNIRVS